MYGPYQGGSQLKDDYSQKTSGARTFKYPSQLRNLKQISMNQKTLMDARKDTSLTKFDGKLEVAEDDPAQLDKEQFITAVADEAKYYGLESFFSITREDGSMTSILKESHAYTVDEVTAEYMDRLNEPPLLLDEDTGDETDESIIARLKAYDDYELNDLLLSRMMIESLLSASFREKLDVRFSHVPNFEELPGQVIFMMTLEACNASANLDVEGAKLAFQNLKLTDYPGENVEAFATEALRLLKIMNGDYAMPLHTGSQLLKKVSQTQSTYFNRRIHGHLDIVKPMENKYKLKDPALLKRDREYHEYGPLGCCGLIQAEYGELYAEKDWPALIESRPEANLSTPVPRRDRQKNSGGRKCYKCGSEYHLANDPTCPRRNQSNQQGTDSSRNEGSNNDERNEGSPPTNESTTRNHNGWKYIHPADPDQMMIGPDGKEWHFCKFCKCRRTEKVGMYTLSHSSRDHVENYQAAREATETPEAPQGNLAGVEPDLSGPVQSGLAKEAPNTSDDDDELTFVGPAAWVAEVNATDRIHGILSVSTPSHSDSEKCDIKTIHSHQDTLKQRVDPSTPQEDGGALSETPTMHQDDRLSYFNSCFCFFATLWQDILIVGFGLSTLFWDGISLLRRSYSVNRKDCTGFPKRWMMLSFIMFFHTFLNGPSQSLMFSHLILTPHRALNLSLTRARDVASLVHMSPLVIIDYNISKLSTLYNQCHLVQFFSRTTNSNPDLDESCKDPSTIDGMFNWNSSVFDSSSEDPPSIASPHLCTAAVFDWINTEYPSLNLTTSDPLKNKFPIIFDTGASLAVSGFKEDFVGSIVTPQQSLTLGGMAQGISIAGTGVVQWAFQSKNQEEIIIKTHCYYVPNAKVRILSPQRLFCEEKGIIGSFQTEEKQAKLTINGSVLHIDYHERSFLPISYATNALSSDHQVNLSILSEDNQNLTPAQKLLLSWHYRLGHKYMGFIQQLFRSLNSVFCGDKFVAASRCIQPKCEICQYAKAKRRPLKGSVRKLDGQVTGSCKANHLRPGQTVSVDHFESRLKGRTYTSFGKTTSSQYVGGCIFVDHMSSKMHVEHQLGFSASETIRTKQNFE